MSSPAPTVSTPHPTTADDEAPPPQDGWPGGLPALRAELDRIDDALHGLLLQRAEVVEAVAKSGKRAAWRPGREASIIRRLLSHHTGRLPADTIFRIWRELLAGTTAMQGDFTIAVYERGSEAALTQLMREHFGVFTRIQTCAGASQAIEDVRSGLASAAVLPMPSETETWWTTLLCREEPRIHIAARLPFWECRPDGAPTMEGLVISLAAPDPSGEDRTLLGLEVLPDTIRDRLAAGLTSAGLARPVVLAASRIAGAPLAQALVEVEGWIEEEDARLANLSSSGVVLGSYAVPVHGRAHD